MRRESVVVAVVLSLAPASADADTTCEWYGFADTIARDAQPPTTGAPRSPEHAHAVTQVALAIFEAVNTIERRYESYLDLPVFEPWAVAFKPWFLRSVDQVRPVPPPALTSERWPGDLDEVRRRGGRNRTERAPHQTLMTRYRITPDMMPSMRLIADAKDRWPVENARLFALADMVADDAGMATAAARLRFNFWRQVTAIRNAEDYGNVRTEPDPAWTPLIPTPNHPEYPCGHCTQAGALTAVLEAEVGKAPPGGVRVTSRSLPTSVVQVLPSFDDWVREVFFSRTLGGVHYRSSNEAGEEVGRKVAAVALASSMRPLRKVASR